MKYTELMALHEALNKIPTRDYRNYYTLINYADVAVMLDNVYEDLRDEQDD